MLKLVWAAVIALAMTGCATAPSNNYAQYLDTIEKIESNKAVAAENSRMAKSAEYADLQAACKTGDCAATVAAFKAITDVVASLADGAGGKNSGIAAPPREVSTSEQLLGWAGVLVPGLTQWSSIVQTNETQRHLSDNNADVTISSNETWASIINGQSTAWSGAVGTVAATPSINVGGNYGDTSTAGNNLTSGDGNNVGNSGRIGSDGPYDSSGDCRDDATCGPLAADDGGF